MLHRLEMDCHWNATQRVQCLVKTTLQSSLQCNDVVVLCIRSHHLAECLVLSVASTFPQEMYFQIKCCISHPIFAWQMAMTCIKFLYIFLIMRPTGLYYGGILSVFSSNSLDIETRICGIPNSTSCTFHPGQYK